MQYIAETKEFQITEPTVVSIGKFDGLHVGHQKLVREMVRWKEKGLKVAMFTFFHAAPEPGGRPEADCPHDQPGADGAPALGRGGLSGGISL